MCLKKFLLVTWYSRSLLIHFMKKINFINYIESRGLETRPIISGSFTNQPSSKLFKLNPKNKKFLGAENVQELGFVIGLHKKN